MNTQTANVLEKMWCGCVGHSIEHERVGVQTFGRTLLEVYQCRKCHGLKRVKVETTETHNSRVYRLGTLTLP
jgi:hypothetical protein